MGPVYFKNLKRTCNFHVRIDYLMFFQKIENMFISHNWGLFDFLRSTLMNLKNKLDNQKVYFCF